MDQRPDIERLRNPFANLDRIPYGQQVHELIEYVGRLEAAIRPLRRVHLRPGAQDGVVIAVAVTLAKDLFPA